MESARVEFKRPATFKPDWPIDGPDHPVFGRFFMRDGKPAEMTATERQEAWEREAANRKEIEERMAQILGDEEQDILPDFWFMRGRDIQEKLGKLTRYGAALATQTDSCRQMFNVLKARRMAL